MAKALLEDLVARGVSPSRRRLFVIDGSKALPKAIDQVFRANNPVQRCGNHKVRNVLGHLPKEQHDQARLTLKAAFKLEAEEGTDRAVRLVAGAGLAWRCGLATRRPGGAVHDQPSGPAFDSAALPGHDQPDWPRSMNSEQQRHRHVAQEMKAG